MSPSNEASNGLNAYYNHAEEELYEVRELPLYTKSKVSIVCIGAGVSGLATAVKVQETLKDCDFTIYEKNGDLGGTWLENRYPGCACDVPAHAYAYTFEPNPDYSRYYVGSVEIHGYLKAVAEKYDLNRSIQYHHKLISAIWNENDGMWDLDFEVTSPDQPNQKRLFQRHCNVLLNAGGLLNNWKWPTIPGLASFKGHLCHSALWNDNFDWKGKTVAVIGSGSSAIQIVPELQPLVAKLKSFIRSPTWIAPSQGFVDPKTAGPKNFFYTQEEKDAFRNDPDMFLKYRKQIESDMNRTFDTFLKDSPKQHEARKAFAQLMKDRLGGDEELAARLVPPYGVGCRRLTPGPNFLESLAKENVDVITQDIDHIEPSGLVTQDGTLHKVDALICATGFDTTYKPRFKLIGRQGVSLADVWQDTNSVEAYLAMAIAGFPNYFMFLGPNAPISNGTLIPVLEKQCEFMLKFVEKMQCQQLKSFAVKSDVVTQLNKHHQHFLRRMVFADDCRSWYKGGRKEGKVIGIWPGSSLHYYEAISEPRYEDFDYTYRSSNMWNFLGDGWTRLEAEDKEMRDQDVNGGLDLAWYLQKPAEVLHAPDS